jgi:hypothetical protein
MDMRSGVGGNGREVRVKTWGEKIGIGRSGVRMGMERGRRRMRLCRRVVRRDERCVRFSFLK